MCNEDYEYTYRPEDDEEFFNAVLEEGEPLSSEEEEGMKDF